MLPGAFLDKFTPDIDFIDKAVVMMFQFKNTFLGACNLQMITCKFRCEYR